MFVRIGLIRDMGEKKVGGSQASTLTTSLAPIPSSFATRPPPGETEAYPKVKILRKQVFVRIGLICDMGEKKVGGSQASTLTTPLAPIPSSFATRPPPGETEA